MMRKIPNNRTDYLPQGCTEILCEGGGLGYPNLNATSKPKSGLAG